MDNSKIYQSELPFELGNGQGSINLFTGRLLFSYQDRSVGIESHNLTINHVYNSQFSLPSRFGNKCGNKWKLNLEQYMYNENNKYIYIDEVGMKHEFEKLIGTKYYDTSGLNYIFDSSNKCITTQNGVELKFENERLVEIIYENYSKVIAYNSSGQIERYYDTKNNQNRIHFTYNDEGLLKSCYVYGANSNHYYLYYKYDSDNNLIEIKKATYKGEKQLFRYEYNSVNELTKIINYNTKQVIEYDYLLNKVKQLDIYNANIIPIKDSVDEYLGNGVIVGDNKYFGDKETIITGENIEKTDSIDIIDIVYETSNGNTKVINSNGVCNVYFYDQDGTITAVLEKVDDNEYKSNKNYTGLILMNSGSESEKIDNSNAYICTNNILSLYDVNDELLNYNKQKLIDEYNGITRFNISFYLKLVEPLLSDQVTITLHYDEYNKVGGYGYIKKDLLNVWQEVTIPIAIETIDFVNIKINFKKIANSTVSFYISNMLMTVGNGIESLLINKIIPNTSTEIEASIFAFHKLSELEYLENNQLINENLWQSTKFTFNDLLQLQREYLFNDSEYHILSLNNCRLKKYVKNIKFKNLEGITNININDYNLKIMNINYNDMYGSSKKYCYELREDLPYLNIIQKEEYANGISREGYQLYNMKNMLLEEKNIKGVIKYYQYNDYDELVKVSMKNPESDEINDIEIYDIFSNQIKIITKDNIINQIYGNDCLLTKEIISSRSNNNDTIITLYSYDIFNENLIEIERKDGNTNFIKYSTSGKTTELKSSKYINDKNPYNVIYEFDYTPFKVNENTYQSQVVSNLKYYDQNNQLQRKVINKLKYFKETVNDELRQIVQETKGDLIYEYVYDKKGRIIATNTNGYDRLVYSYYVYDGLLNENTNDYMVIDDVNMLGKNELNYENKIVQNYFYDISSQNSQIKLLTKTVQNDKISYKEAIIQANIYNSFNDIVRNNFGSNDSNNIFEYIRERNYIFDSSVSKSKVKLLLNEDYIETAYQYDCYGRLTKKELINPLSTLQREKKFITEYIYDNETNSLLSILINLENCNYYIENDLDYDYLGRVTSNLLRYRNNSNQIIYTNNCSYKYDINNQLIEDSSYLGTKYYTYYDDGSINTIQYLTNNETNTYSYIYQNGLLTEITKNGNEYIQLGYNENRDCILYKKNNVQSSFDWCENKLTAVSDFNKTILFEYSNINGKRYQKIFSNRDLNVSYSVRYYYDDNLLIKEERENESIIYLYDEQGLYGFSIIKNGILYRNFYYIKNFDNSVMGIIDDDYRLIGKYNYDAYGNHEIISENINVLQSYTNEQIMEMNPIRYKGYYYDVETQLYLVSSRYYSPELCRFISPDSVDYLDPSSINGLNLYAYCNNDPINYADPSGHVAISIGLLLAIGGIVGAVIGAGASVAGQYLANGCSWENFSWGQLALDTVLGGVSGMLSMSPLGWGTMIAANAGIGFVGAVGGHLINGSDFSKLSTWVDIGLSTGLGALVGVVGGPGALNAGYLNGAKQTAGFIRAAGLYDDVLTKAVTGFYRTPGIASNALRLSGQNLVKQWNKMVVSQAGKALTKALAYGGTALLIGTAGKGWLYDWYNDYF